MPPTLRRSCSACATAKSRCDLRTPLCSRCARRRISCVYANQPLSSSLGPLIDVGRFGAVDPFESYPQVRLPREHVQRLIHRFLYKIAFQYYPIDLNPNSNPFLISWWPLALGDATLFHVSLQTACLDEEFFGQRGFCFSDLLMADSVALLRRKVQDRSLAIQDDIMNSVITLATIEFGKGNIETAGLHIAGVKRLVDMRGGIQAVMQTSPLTARMVSWVSVLITGTPQFETQNDEGIGDGIMTIPEWQMEPTFDHVNLPLADIDDHPLIWNIFLRLYNIFHRVESILLAPTRLHDLTCYVVHRLLLSSPASSETPSAALSDCLRSAIILYLLILQGPIYYTSAIMSYRVTPHFVAQLRQRAMPHSHDPIDLWLVAVGLVASHGTPQYPFFQERTRLISSSLRHNTWEDSSGQIQAVLWLAVPHIESVFRSHWDLALGLNCQLVTLQSAQIAPVASNIAPRIEEIEPSV